MRFKVLIFLATLISLGTASSFFFVSNEPGYSQFFVSPEETQENLSSINGTTFATSNGTGGTSNEGPKEPGFAEIVLLSQKLKKPSYGYRDLVGEVRNIGNASAHYVKIILTTYDKNGQVLERDYAYTDHSIVKPDQKTSFKLIADSNIFKGMDYYELTLEWFNPDRSNGDVSTNFTENVGIYNGTK